MRITALACATLLALGLAHTTLAQAPASAKANGCIQCQHAQPTSSGASLTERRNAVNQACEQCQQQQASQQAMAAGAAPAQPPVQQTMFMVPQQLPDGQQIVVLIPAEFMTGGVEQTGHHHAAAAAPCNQPGTYAPGGNPFYYDRGAMYGYNHPNAPHGGGHYGYWGGAHRTPGYPHHHLQREYVGPPGPPTAQVSYPYYTVRGPRDFLMDNPPSIGR
jgi:hypothetical protein